jgi:aminoglycoside phosphotransferase (APT) family kinase protein
MTGTAPHSLRNAEFVRRWFRARLDQLRAGAREVQVDRVDRLSRGVSRQTWTVDIRIDGRPASYIVRRDHEAGSVIPTPLRLEYEVYRRLGPVGVPTARALWFEDDPDWQPDGRPAYVRERIDGDWHLPFLTDDSAEYDAQRIAVSKEHLDMLAILHTTDWEAAGFGELFAVPAGPQDCARNLIRANLRVLEQFQFEPSPAVAEGVAQLIERAPEDAPRISLCKGTNGHGEEVWSGGRIVAMSDWELACLADPAYDFALMQEMIPQIMRDGRRIWGLPEALAYYQGRTGIEVTVARIGFYKALYGLLQFIYAHHSGYLIRERGFRDLRFLWTAWENSYRSAVRLGREFDFSAEEVVSV